MRKNIFQKLVKESLDEKIYPQILHISAILDDNYLVNSQHIIEERKQYCKHCSSKKFFKKVLSDPLYLEDEFPLRVNVER